MFAKLFGSDDDQILVMLDEGDDGPQVRFYFQPADFGVINTVIEFSDSDAGWEQAAETFKTIDFKSAKGVVAKVVAGIGLKYDHP